MDRHIKNGPSQYIWAKIKVSGLVVKPVTTEVLGYAEVPLKQPEVTTLDGLTTSASSSGANAVRPKDALYAFVADLEAFSPHLLRYCPERLSLSMQG